MFINCPSCRALVATDPATDQPPERCPRCAERLREAPPESPSPADDARSGVAAAIAEAFGGELAAQPDPSTPPVSIANLLQPQEPPDAPAPEPAPEADPAPVPDPEPTTTAGTGSAEAVGPVPAPAPPGRRGDAPQVRPAPSFLRRRGARAGDGAPARRWPLPAAVAGLSLLLALQWLVADRARLAADPTWRPVVARVCGALGCSLPPWREPAAFVLLDRDVRPHPEVPGVLRITASFRNDAAWPQAWPQVVLTLTNLEGRPLGARAFTAAEYLDRPPTADLASGDGAVIRMDVREPGPGAVGFAFDFH
ncbi:MAG: DUF3426 domain-containing protein [Gammaproteobacteria bacterium]|jgi:hypothetical protein|nr:DUF3426 domain-containing protein [Gammaproteobacteria bacterium]